MGLASAAKCNYRIGNHTPCLGRMDGEKKFVICPFLNSTLKAKKRANFSRCAYFGGGGCYGKFIFSSCFYEHDARVSRTSERVLELSKI